MKDQQTKLFYNSSFDSNSKEIKLSEDESYHASKVLRLHSGELVSVTNGRGLISEAIIVYFEKESVLLKVQRHSYFQPPKTKIHLAISPVKKRTKIEWLVEKCTELGISEISFIISKHSERTVINLIRLEKVVISAMKQSLNPYKPVVNSIRNFELFINGYAQFQGHKFIAHCNTESSEHLSKLYIAGKDTLICVGPEGGFSEKEISMSASKSFEIVNLGDLRLRSETAALSSLITLNTLNAMDN